MLTRISLSLSNLLDMTQSVSFLKLRIEKPGVFQTTILLKLYYINSSPISYYFFPVQTLHILVNIFLNVFYLDILFFVTTQLLMRF